MPFTNQVHSNESIDQYEGGKPSKTDSAKKGKEDTATKAKEVELTPEQKKAKEVKNALC